MRSLLKKMIPEAGRRALRRAIGDRNLQKAVAALRRNGKFSIPELVEFRKAWGNEGFSADLTYLAETIRLITQYPTDVLECGTGATTIIAGVLAELYGFDVYCLEQDPEWSQSVRRSVKINGLNRVHIIDAHLIKHSDYMWYDMSAVKLPHKFGVVLCDAPFIAEDLGEPFFSSWRYGILPFCRQSGTSFRALLLDDLNDNYSRAEPVLARWRSEFQISQDVISSSEGECAVIRLP
jgi:hypothetical protein